MSEHCGQVTHHFKRRGKIRCCDWCGQKIEIGERYAKWLYFDAGERQTVYAHAECAEAWQEAASDENGVVYADGSCDRPNAKLTCAESEHKMEIKVVNKQNEQKLNSSTDEASSVANVSCVRANKLVKGCVVMMKAESGVVGYGNPQCVSSVCEPLDEISLYGHNQLYKTWDIQKIIEYPLIEQNS